MAKQKPETKEVEVKEVEKKKYIAKAVLVNEDAATVHVGEEIELTEKQAERLLELDAIEAPEAE